MSNLRAADEEYRAARRLEETEGLDTSADQSQLSPSSPTFEPGISQIFAENGRTAGNMKCEQLISEVHANCLTSFVKLIAALDAPTRDFRHQAPMDDLHDEFDKYKVWAGNVGAAHSRKRYQISLDYRLREASFYKTQVIKLLNTLDCMVQRALELTDGERRPFEETESPTALINSSDNASSNNDVETNDSGEAEDVDSPWEISSSSSGDSSKSPQAEDQNTTTAMTPTSKPKLFVARKPTIEMPQLVDSIKFTITCLYRIPIRRPAPADRLKQQTSVDMSLYQHFDVLYVRDKFPTADIELVTRLGKIITKRRHILAYRISHNEALQTKVQEPKPKPQMILPGMSHPTGQQAPSARGEAALPLLDKTQSLAAPSTKIGTKATTLRGNMPQILEIGDPTALYAPSLTESKASMASSYANELRVDIPPRPKGEDGQELDLFECPYCLIACRIKTPHAWK
jgi:hypothetical protein